MSNRTLTLAIGLCLLAAAVGKLLLESPAHADLGSQLLTWGAGFSQPLSLILLVTNGTILGTWYARVMLALYGLLVVGVFFKILHWQGSDYMLGVSLAGIALTYSIRFIRKAHRRHLDVLKLLWVLASSGSALLLFQHLVPRETAYVAPVLLGLAVLDFLYLESRQQTVSP